MPVQASHFYITNVDTSVETHLEGIREVQRWGCQSLVGIVSWLGALEITTRASFARASVSIDERSRYQTYLRRVVPTLSLGR